MLVHENNLLSPAVVTLSLISENLGVNCRDLRTLMYTEPAVLTFAKFMPGRIINEWNVII